MKNLSIIQEREQATRREIVDSVLTNLERFRADAAKALKAFTRDERVLLAGLEADDISSYAVFVTWEDMLRPLRQTLHSKRSDRSFRTQLMKHLVLTDENAQMTINQLIDRRRTQALEDCLLAIYPHQNGKKDPYRTQRAKAESLLLRSDREIQILKDHFVGAVLYKETAAEYGVIIMDAHRSVWVRMRTARRIRSQRKKTLAFEKKRLRDIERRHKELAALDNGLVGEILEKDWDLIEVLALRNHYEKSLKRLTKDSDTMVKRLALFDKETITFRNKHTEKTIGKSTHTSLESVRKLSESIDTLLLRIFDLSSVQKNQLLLYTKEYRELDQERAGILQTQHNRSLLK